MTRANVRRLGGAGVLFVCLVALPGQASADPAQKFSITGPATVNEGATATYTVSLTDGEDADATVKFNAAPSGPTSASDYAITPDTLTVPKGGSQTFTVQATPDTTDEVNEPFVVSLSEPVRATLDAAATSVTTTIIDDDTPALSIDNVSPNEGDLAHFTISLSQPAASPVTVTYATANGTAVAPGDYTVASATVLTFTPGQTTKTVDVPTIDETPALDENNETFALNLTNASANVNVSDATGTGTIVDDDAEPSIKSIVDISVAEGNTGTVDAVMTVELTAASGKTITVLYTTVPGTASDAAPADYQPLSGSLVYTPGQTSKTITVKVVGDTLFESNEKFSVALTDPDNAGPEPDNRGEITITDDDSTPVPTLNNPAVAEGDSGLTPLAFDATLPCPRSAVSFNYRTVADTATASDFTEVGGATLSFNSCGAGASTVLKITIQVKGDTLDEVNESFKLELLNPTTGAVVRTAIGTISNDDNNSKLSIGDASSDEPGTLTFPVTLSQASAREVKINWATADGTAAAGSDYTGGSGTVTFAPGETAKSIAVAVLGDGATEENETMKVLLSGPVGVPEGNVLDGEGAGTIIDRNAPPSLSISDALGREGGGVTFTVSLAGTTLRTVTVRFNTADGTAKAPGDYAGRAGTLTFEPGEKSKTVAVSITDDTEAEPVEEFFVVIGDAVNATITKNRGQGSIEASDRPDAPPTTDPTTKPPVAKPVSVLVPRMILGPRTVSIGANGLARMLVTCQKLSPIGCAGSVELERATKPLLKLGKRTFTVKKGAKGYASIKLSLKTLKLLQKNGTMRAKVIVLVKTSAKTMKVSPGVITLKATRALKTAKLKPPAPSTKVVVDP